MPVCACGRRAVSQRRLGGVSAAWVCRRAATLEPGRGGGARAAYLVRSGGMRHAERPNREMCRTTGGRGGTLGHVQRVTRTLSQLAIAGVLVIT